MSAHLRETLEQAGVTLYREDAQSITVETDEGKHELWAKSPNFAGAALLHNGCEYEFVSEVANPKIEREPTITLNLFTTSVDYDGRTVVTACKTYCGWRWYSNLGRTGRRFNFPSAEAALRAGAKTIGLKITEIVE